ncbi:hypothetical protein [Actinacidiphila yanglinensis]|uniref:hypothetical protein n=1 Tax=Actinacidiphila yanglinensis TaxID=310779 RepID=UPI001359B22E|nr:hypothetical protein [Actinacidiphila yanglinensis]
MSAGDPLAQHLQSQADEWAAAIGSQDPPASGSDLAWQQDMVRDAYADAAHLADQQQ